MSFLRRLFGGQTPPAATPASEEGQLAGETDLIGVFDAYGREMMVRKQDWRDNVLVGSLENARNDPDQLYSMLVSALGDGLAGDVLNYAEHLHRIDTTPSRGATLLGVFYMEVKRLADAERVFMDYVRRYGEDGVLLANLAKVYSLRGETERAESTLWRALEIDPNQDFGVNWFYAQSHQRGEQAGLAALRRLAALPGSWRALLWLARAALDREQKNEALDLYTKMLAIIPRPAPADVLMQMSGDLGNDGHLVEALRLTLPHFDPAHHGLQVGNNLIKANLDLGRLDHARAIVEQLYAQQRRDWQQALGGWDAEIAKARTKAEGASLPARPRAITLCYEGPIWLLPSVASLFGEKHKDAVVVCFLAASVHLGETGLPRLQMSNAYGRLARALPLFLCEQFHLRTDGVGQVMQPFIAGTPGGFVLSGMPWDDDQAIAQARAADPQGDYVVLSHFVATREPYGLCVRLVRTIDGSQLATVNADVDPQQPGPAFTKVANWLLATVEEHTQVDRQSPPPAYEIPQGQAFGDYQLRLEQALAVRSSTSDAASLDFLSGEREIVMGMLKLCLDQPLNITTRTLLASTLAFLKTMRPHVVAEFREKVERLQRESPLAQPAQEVLQGLFDRIYLP